MALKNIIAQHEGFSTTPYIDPLVKRNPEAHGVQSSELAIAEKILNNLKLTFGYGFTFITEEEALAILQMRIDKISNQLSNKMSFYNNLDQDIKDMLTEMSFQMGVEGVMNFQHMLEAIENEDWCKAHSEGMDSKWYKETKDRAIAVLSPLSNRCKKQQEEDN